MSSQSLQQGAFPGEQGENQQELELRAMLDDILLDGAGDKGYFANKDAWMVENHKDKITALDKKDLVILDQLIDAEISECLQDRIKLEQRKQRNPGIAFLRSIANGVSQSISDTILQGPDWLGNRYADYLRRKEGKREFLQDLPSVDDTLQGRLAFLARLSAMVKAVFFGQFVSTGRLPNDNPYDPYLNTQPPRLKSLEQARDSFVFTFETHGGPLKPVPPLSLSEEDPLVQ